MKPCVAIPVYDHGDTIAGVVDSLAHLQVPCLIVDDGSGAATRREIERLARSRPWVEVERHPRNRGRGSALRTAYRRAGSRGMTHVVQLDADGQHDPRDVPRFLAAAEVDPDALILGVPVFDESAPRSRLWGRKLSQAIVWLETLSLQVRDPLCGFRCIPLLPTLRLLDRVSLGDRMEFDPELVVRLVRDGVRVVSLRTAVRYDAQGRSHFRMLEDNLRIAWAYARLTTDALRQAPRFLGRPGRA